MMVYIAGPYSSDPLGGVNNMIDAAEKVVAAGHVPHVPLLYHFWHERYPHEALYWLRLDRHYLALCDVLVRLPGQSPGSDLEVEWAHELGITAITWDEWEGQCLNTASYT